MIDKTIQLPAFKSIAGNLLTYTFTYEQLDVPSSQIESTKDCYLLSGKTMSDSDCISLTSGGTALSPATGVLYIVSDVGEYLWDGTSYVKVNAYIDVTTYGNSANDSILSKQCLVNENGVTINIQSDETINFLGKYIYQISLIIGNKMYCQQGTLNIVKNIMPSRLDDVLSLVAASTDIITVVESKVVGETEYSATWLGYADSGVVITPSATEIYYIPSGAEAGTYKWNTTSSIYETTVDDYGLPTANTTDNTSDSPAPTAADNEPLIVTTCLVDAIVTGVTAYAEDWLSYNDGTSIVIAPKSDLVYSVATGTYAGNYQWSGTAYTLVELNAGGGVISSGEQVGEEVSEDDDVTLEGIYDMAIISGSTLYSAGWLALASAPTVAITPDTTSTYMLNNSTYGGIYHWDGTSYINVNLNGGD